MVLVSQPVYPDFDEPSPPLANRVLMNAKPLGNFLALKAFCTKQDYSAPVRK